jgi:pyridoxal phosphate enzyme (YggS family)
MSLEDIRKRIASACKAAGRDLASVTLIAVSKSQPPDRIGDVLKAGQRVFGENRVQEAFERWPKLRVEYPNIALHFIGHLQTNKAKEAVALFDAIETVDSERLAAALKDEMEKQKRNLPCFLQVNTGEEPQKAGVAPHDLEKLYHTCRDLKLDVRGLMCIPPEGDIPDLHFALLRKLGGELGLPCLSMGMSADFETAIRYGATHVRIGSAVFGDRKAS